LWQFLGQKMTPIPVHCGINCIKIVVLYNKISRENEGENQNILSYLDSRGTDVLSLRPGRLRMKFTLSICLFLLAMILFSACSLGPATTPNSTSSLPDLVVSNVYLGMQGVPTNWTECIPNYGPFEIRAMVRNLGGAPAYNIVMAELSTVPISQLGN
jgi:hypothetical protein